jgi:hypothetical protein
VEKSAALEAFALSSEAVPLESGQSREYDCVKD